MKVYIEKQDRNLEIATDKISGRELLEDLHINPSSTILIRNNEVVLEDELLDDSDDVKILSVISGG